MYKQTWKNNEFVEFGMKMPKSMRDRLQEAANEMGLPVARLICYAIDNEFCAPAPFVYPCLLPSNIYIESAYIGEAQKIVRFLEKFKQGLGRDSLMLFRHDMGIPNKETFMLAYRELLEAEIIKEVPVPPRSKFKYPSNYKYTQLVYRQDTRRRKPLIQEEPYDE